MNKISVEAPSEIRSIRKISSEILKSLSPYDVDKDRLFDIRLCTEEALRNAIVHGNKADKDLHIKVRYWIETGKIAIEIEDEGAGFDPAAVADPTENSNIMKGSGRGIYLIRKLMDRVDYNKKGNTIRMEKALK